MKKVGMLFAGYGSQFIGMGKELYDHSRVIQERFEEASDCLGINFVKLCFASSEAEINKITNGYLSLFVLQAAIADKLKNKGIVPSLVAGVDAGEYSALYAAECLTFADALYFINKYASAYEALVADGKYVQICVKNYKRAALEELCEQLTTDTDYAAISVYGSETDHCVSGTVNAIETCKELLKKKKASVKKVSLGSGLHLFAMDPVVKSIKMYLEKVDFKSTTIPYMSGLIGQTLTDGEVIASALMQQIHAPTHLDGMLHAFADCDLVVQVGPGVGSLQSLFNTIFPEKTLYTVENFEQWELFKKVYSE